MATMRQDSGAGNPETGESQVDGPGEPGDARGPVDIVADALVKFEILELTWEEVATLTLKALTGAGYRIVRTEEIGWTGVDDEHDDGEWFFHFEDEGRTGYRDVRPAFHVTEEWEPQS